MAALRAARPCKGEAPVATCPGLQACVPRASLGCALKTGSGCSSCPAGSACMPLLSSGAGATHACVSCKELGCPTGECEPWACGDCREDLKCSEVREGEREARARPAARPAADPPAGHGTAACMPACLARAAGPQAAPRR